MITKVKAVIGYTLAALAVPVVLAVFIGQNYLMNGLVTITGIKVSPWMTGGDVVQVIEHGAYKTSIHETVFGGLLGEKGEGLVQVDWTPAQDLPEIIEEEVDYDRDGKNDFKVQLNTKINQGQITSISPLVVSLEKTYLLKDGRAIRVWIKNPRI